MARRADPFDPNIHNAVMHVEDETLDENIVTDVFSKGYQLGDRVLRHAMVKELAKGQRKGNQRQRRMIL